MEENKDRRSWIYDIETLASCFTYSAINIDTKEVVQYVIHKDRNDLDKLINHLLTCKGHVGFNNLNFDYPIIHHLLKSYWKFLRESKEVLVGDECAETFIKLIYKEAQRIIEEQNKESFNISVAIKQSEVIIPQLDLFKLWHFNNKARSQSLKGLEIAMNYPNVMDMPIDHKRLDISLEEIPMILEYNLNDVMATHEFYLRSKEKIDLRKSIKEKYNIPCTNFSDSKIGEQLVLDLYCKATGQDPWDVKKLRSERLQIDLSKCIFPYIKFESKEFNELLKYLNSKIIKETKNAFEYSIIYKGFKYDYGTGGIHGCIKPGIYESDDDHVILDADVGSLYPSIAVQNKLFPEHLGEHFCPIYEDILKQRIKAKKEGNMAISDALKLSLNSVYGKSNDKYSFLLDPIYTMKTTINGELMLSMLCESLVNNIPDLLMLQVNTDGLTVKIHKKYIDLYHNLCKKWEDYTKLQLEFVTYTKMIIRDVNNYISVKTDGKCKYKGAFEIDKDYHKDNSWRIIPLALSNFFVKNIPVEDTISNHNDIYDFCGRQKFKGGDYGTTHTIIGDKIVIEKQQKNVRYYISNKGSSFIKNYQKGTNEIINKGYQVTIFNKFIKKDIKEYDINYNFYIRECYKEIDNIVNKQYKLEF